MWCRECRGKLEVSWSNEYKNKFGHWAKKRSAKCGECSTRHNTVEMAEIDFMKAQREMYEKGKEDGVEEGSVYLRRSDMPTPKYREKAYELLCRIRGVEIKEEE